MSFITSEMLKRFLEQDKRKFEGLFSELVKRLILSSCQSVSNIRMPGRDDVWAPGFDGIVESQEQTPYVAAGVSVWEFGTNADSLSKINKDYQKRTNNPLGIDKSTTVFYFVIPRIWAYDNQGMSKTKWESEHKDDWLGVHIYDASVLCDWLDSEPAVSAWLIEQFGEGKHLSFSTVTGGWRSFCNRTNMDDDTAIIFMVDSNLQREHILPSERAFAYRMKLEAIKHQGARTDLGRESTSTLSGIPYYQETWKRKYQRFRKTEDFSKLAAIRNGVETLPSMLRRRHQVDRMPAHGLKRCRLFFGVKVGALNLRKFFLYQGRRDQSAQNQEASVSMT